MKVKMKQNKNSSVIRVASALLALFVLLFSLCVPSFAYTDTSTNGVGFDASPFPVNVITSIGTGIDYNSTPAANYSYGINAKDFSVSASNLYVFLYLDSGSYHVGFASDSSFSFTGSTFFQRPNGTYAEGYYQKSFTLASQIGNIYTTYNTVDTVDISIDEASSGTWTVPFFNSLDAGCAALADWIANPPGVVTPHPLNISVPAGNAVYIDVTGVSTVQASFSMSSEVAHPQSWVSNQYYGWASSYPSSIAGNPSGSIPIPWSGFGDKTIFNRYKSFSWSLTSVGSSNYLFICNPYASIDEYDQSFNPTIYVHLNEAVGYKYYQLTGGIGSDGTIGQQSDGTTASGSYNDSTQSWDTTNDQTGLPWTPSEGGGNLITTNSINDWLKTIATQISNFFAGAIGAVTTLVGAGSDFINSLSSLYSWLPGPVYAVLSSALILVITIGVIKVFI